jgi:diguanylate cyclase (GGDEF)-like protein
MRSAMEPDVLANWVSMLRADVVGAIWLPDDDEEARFYQRIAHRDARIVPTVGSALALLHIVEQRGVKGVVAVVRMTEMGEVSHSSVFYPAVGDVASLLLQSTAFDLVVEDTCGTPWVNAFVKANGSLALRSLGIASVFTKVRQWTIEHARSTPTDMDLWATVDWSDSRIDNTRLEAACDGWTPANLNEQITAANFKQILAACDGMDVLDVAARVMVECQPHGIKAERPLPTLELISALRTAFPLSDIEIDDMFWKMRRWERHNPQYPLLRRWRSLDPLGVATDQRYWEPDLKCLLRFESKSLGLVKLDLDGFKNVNTVLGHSGGDEGIRLACRIAEQTLGGVGEVYRRGGDEIIAIAPDTSAIELARVCELTRARIETEFASWCSTRGVTPPVTASIGATLRRADEDYEALIARIDEIQNRAKSTGKNRSIVET